MKKITVIGAGAVGATAAEKMALMQLAHEIVLFDIKEGLAEGKAIDMMQSFAMLGCETRIKGVTNDYKATADSDVVVITSGLPRKPGMTREELIGVNAGIVKQVIAGIMQHSKNPTLVIVSNPMDTMNYLSHQLSGLPKNKIVGLGGALDSSRFKYYLSQELQTSIHDVQAIVIGGHGDTTMIPLTRLAANQCNPVSNIIATPKLTEIAQSTMVGGATLTKLLGTSAWYAPGAATAAMVKAIVRDEKKIISCGVKLEGEYGQKDICLVVPVVLGKNGVEKIIELPLTAEEKVAFEKSAAAVRGTNDILSTLKL